MVIKRLLLKSNKFVELRRLNSKPMTYVFTLYIVLLCAIVLYNAIDVLDWQISYGRSKKLNRNPPQAVKVNIEEVRRKKLEEDLANMPLSLMYSWSRAGMFNWQTNRYNSTTGDFDTNCRSSTIARMTRIPVTNVYWQYFVHPINTTPFWFYSAHLDTRTSNPSPYVVRMFFVFRAPADKPNKKFQTPLYCYAWYKGAGRFSRKLIEIKARNIIYLLPDVGLYREYMPAFLSCDLPIVPDMKPVAVSVSHTQCYPTDYRGPTLILENALTLENRYKGKDGTLALCLKELYSITEDRSVRLVEWIEIQKAQKVDKLFIYVLAIHPNMHKVIEYYVNDDFVKSIPITIPGDRQTEPVWLEKELRVGVNMRRSLENVLQNDCFYRVHEHFRYVAICDADEIFLPRNESNLPSYLVALEKRKNYPINSFVFTGAYFPKYDLNDNITHQTELYYKDKKVPDDIIYLMKYIYRTEDQLPTRAKSIHRTEYSLFTSTHWSKKSISKRARWYYFDYNEAFLAHYRGSVWRKTSFSRRGSSKFHDTSILKREPLVLRYKDKVLEGMFAVLNKIYKNDSFKVFL